MQYWLVSVLVLLFSCCANLAFADDSTSTAIDKDSEDISLYGKFFADKPKRFEKTCKGMFKRLHHLENATAADNSSLSLRVLQDKLAETVAKEPKLAGFRLEWGSADADGNGLLTKEEFCNGLRTLLEARKVSELDSDELTKEATAKMKQFTCQFVGKFPGTGLREFCAKPATPTTTEVATVQKRAIHPTTKKLAIWTTALFLGSFLVAAAGLLLGMILPPLGAVLILLGGLANAASIVLLPVTIIHAIAKM